MEMKAFQKRTECFIQRQQTLLSLYAQWKVHGKLLMFSKQNATQLWDKKMTHSSVLGN